MTYAQIEKRIRFLLTGSSTGSLDYLAADMLARLETDLVDDIAKRSRDEQPRMSVYNEDYGMDNGVAEGSSSIDW